MNKKVKILITFIMSLLLIVLFKSDVFGYNIGDIHNYCVEDMCDADNLYCVDYKQKINFGIANRVKFKIKAEVEIEGENATFHDGATSKCRENDIMAAIVGGGVQPIGHGNLTAAGNDVAFNAAQKALFKHWNTWVSMSGANQHGFEEGGTNSKYTNVDAAYSQATTSAEANDYHVKIYFLEVADSSEGWQNLILVEILELPPPPPPPPPDYKYDYVKISGKVWVDGNENKSGSINGTYNSGEKGLDGIRVTLKDKNGNTWASATTTTNGTYTITVNYGYSKGVYKLAEDPAIVKQRLEDGAYVEFEYNGRKYTTVKTSTTGANTSKAIESRSSRASANSSYTKVNPSDINLNNKKYDYEYELGKPSKTVTANTSSVISFANYAHQSTSSSTETTLYCNADGTPKTIYYQGMIKGTYTKTNPNGAWLEPVVLKNQNMHYSDHYVDDLTKPIYVDDFTKPKNGEKIIGYDSLGNPIYEIIGYEKVWNGTYEQKFDHRTFCGSGHGIGSSSKTYLKIENVNLGLFEIEQPDAAIYSDIEKVRVVKNGQEYTYTYGGRELQNVEALVENKVKFGDKYNSNRYTRPINPSDIAAINSSEAAKHDLKVYVTYNIRAANQSNTLYMSINEIVHYYDDDYTIYTGKGTSTTGVWQEKGSAGNGYKKAIGTYSSTEKIAPGKFATTIAKIEFEVSQEAIKGLLNESATLENISEINSYSTWYGSSTICAEQKTARQRGLEKNAYAGMDIDSHPGSVTPGKDNPNTSFEDDTDKSPTFLLTKDPKYKTISGIVWEDIDNKTDDNERLGDGQKNKNEKVVQNVKVELLEVDDKGNIKYENGKPVVAKLYKIVLGENNKYISQAIDAVTYTNEKGEFKFGNNYGNDDKENDLTKRVGLPVGNYVIRYTYGNNNKGEGYISGFEDTTVKNTIGATKINGYEINARNYKSTIITNNHIKNVIKQENLVAGKETKWHLTMDPNVDISVAVDDLNERLQISDLKYNTYDSKYNMSAYTRPVEIQVEYTEGQENKMVEDANGNIEGKKYYTDNGVNTFAKDINVFDFGIIERPREDLVISKTISKIKVVLANEQKIIDGDPRNEKMNYTKAIGLLSTNGNKKPSVAEINNRKKILTIEVDAEIMQGARLEVWYEIAVQNNSEKDYKYKYEYAFTKAPNAVPIAKKTEKQANYYYYGEKIKDGNGKVTHELLTANLIVADYISKEFSCAVGAEAQKVSGEKPHNNINWYKYDANENKNANIKLSAEQTTNAITADWLVVGDGKGYISEETQKALKQEKYQILVTDTFSGLKPGDEAISTLYASKLLSNKETDGSENDYSYDNHVEIIQINREVARTIKKVEDTTRKQIAKSYIPGDYIPPNGDETQDDDKIRIVITPPTGETNYITPIYIISALVGLVTIVAGIIFIKKKVIKK